MTFTLAASPRGARIGFTAAGDQTRQLTIAVLPKAWRPAGSKVAQSREWPPGRQQNVVLYEADRWHVVAPGAGVDELLTRCLQVSRDSQDDLPWEDSALLTPDIAPSAAKLENARWLTPSDSDTGVTDLLMLFDRLEMLFPETDELGSAPAYSPLHRPLLCRRLLDEVLALAQSARRGYRTLTATGGTIRGRILPSSIVRHIMMGDPRLTVSYDELTESTVLLGVVTAALEQIADAVGLRSPFSGRYSVAELQQDAIALRRIFAEITALPSAQARQQGRRLRLSRLDQPWAKALQISLTLLDQNEHSPVHADLRLTDAVELSVPTDKLWERIVTQALRRAGFSTVLPPAAQPAGLTSDPWVSARGAGMGSHPDNVATNGGQLWVVDAKYKTLPDGGWPSREDQYQIFAYSHLVSLDGQTVTRTALIYPGNGATRAWRRGRSSTSAPCDLLAIQIPFPRPGEANSAAHWQRYLDQVGAILGERIATVATPIQLR